MNEWKKAERARLADLRKSIPAEQRAAWSEAACAHAVRLLEECGAERFMAYVAFRSELDTAPLLEWGFKNGKTVIVPRCIPADRSMELYAISGLDMLVPGAYGIMEPDPAMAARVDLARMMPQAVVVPGLAFDGDGGRLGYGGGYYDRFRERIAMAAASSGRAIPPWIGLGFGMQLVESVPMEAHDARMDAIVTECGTRRFTPNAKEGSGCSWS
ncbi:5-formyltetrahydrofolate cyclo-ligase [Paenibacillus methanolicus]|uniref:5-formyltetrahydrofolate cyclo-ligase n=1 Tax=Paenibacillus methanolicus TaxID=582686 RepID=A0A5S5BQS1_9BACL|nr:5-formyltetrahydrofolate cyclo-ligase [Paenibacillus methanolicus]TYP68678.1 5-formyltetrahydrofolate cyclo-ligase [Paenibacillus methanolicus]